MMLKTYIPITIISFVVHLLYSKTLSKKIKKAGYKFKESDSFIESFYTIIKMIITSIIPVVRLLIIFEALSYDEEKFKEKIQKLLDEGTIIPVVSEEELNFEETVEKFTETIEVELSPKTTKSYEEMTTEEKLAWLKQEREKLINQDTLERSNEAPTKTKTLPSSIAYQKSSK